MYESKRAYHYGTGRRKSSVARVRVYENGTGSIIINGRRLLRSGDSEAPGPSAPGRYRPAGQGGSGDHCFRRRCYRPGRRYPSRRFPRPAERESRIPCHPEGRRLPDTRPENEGKKEVRLEGSTSCSSVQQALNCTFYTAKALKTPELSQFRGFSF